MEPKTARDHQTLLDSAAGDATKIAVVASNALRVATEKIEFLFRRKEVLSAAWVKAFGSLREESEEGDEPVPDDQGRGVRRGLFVAKWPMLAIALGIGTWVCSSTFSLSPAMAFLCAALVVVGLSQGTATYLAHGSAGKVAPHVTLDRAITWLKYLSIPFVLGASVFTYTRLVDPATLPDGLFSASVALTEALSIEMTGVLFALYEIQNIPQNRYKDHERVKDEIAEWQRLEANCLKAGAKLEPSPGAPRSPRLMPNASGGNGAGSPAVPGSSQPVEADTADAIYKRWGGTTGALIVAGLLGLAAMNASQAMAAGAGHTRIPGKPSVGAFLHQLFEVPVAPIEPGATIDHVRFLVDMTGSDAPELAWATREVAVALDSLFELLPGVSYVELMAWDGTDRSCRISVREWTLPEPPKKNLIEMQGVRRHEEFGRLHRAEELRTLRSPFIAQLKLALKRLGRARQRGDKSCVGAMITNARTSGPTVLWVIISDGASEKCGLDPLPKTGDSPVIVLLLFRTEDWQAASERTVKRAAALARAGCYPIPMQRMGGKPVWPLAQAIERASLVEQASK